MRSVIPNFITSINLFLGVFSIFATYNNNFDLAVYLIIAALIADSLDGRAARYFKVSSDFGRELDSLCDVVSFGVAPAVLTYAYYLKDLGYIGMMVAAIFATAGALRLARFNVNTSVVKGYFMGLPIPAAGCVVAAFTLTNIKPNIYLYLIFVLVFAYLMVSTIRYPDFKGKDGEKILLIPVIITVLVSLYLVFALPNSLIFTMFFAFAIFGVLNTFGANFSKSS